MSRALRFTITVAAVVVVVVAIGLVDVLTRATAHGKAPLAASTAATTPAPLAASTAATTPAPLAASTAASAAVSLPGTPDSPAVLDGGTYRIGDPFPVPVTVTVPAGWTGEVAGQYAAFLTSASTTGPATIAFTLSENVIADPCMNKGFLDPQPGPSVDDLTSALTHLKGVVATTPTAVTVDGVEGKQFTLTAPKESADCSGSVDGYELWALPLGHTFALGFGERMAVWVLDDHGTRLLVSRQTSPYTSAQDRAAVRAILNSVHLGTPA